jgi:hypothetical protein
MRTRVVVVGLALAAAAAPWQANGQAAQGPQKSAKVGPTSNAFDKACLDLLEGRMPQGEKEIKTLRDACAKLMSGRADDRIDAERQRQQQQQAQEQLRQQQLAAQEQLKLQAQGKAPKVQPGQATAQPQPGQDIPAAFGAAAGELAGQKKPLALGMRAGGRPVNYLLFTDPVSWFTGLGINATIYGTLPDLPKFSWVAGARYSATDTTNGNTIGFGGEIGVDWYIIGQHNEGLRLGPRFEAAAGRERFNSTATSGSTSTTFGRLGLAGEFGYNFIASNGISALAAVGIGGRIAGNGDHNNFSSYIPGDFGPYVVLGVGFGW